MISKRRKYITAFVFSISPFIISFLFIDIWRFSKNYYDIPLIMITFLPIPFLIYWFGVGYYYKKLFSDLKKAFFYSHCIGLLALGVFPIQSENTFFNCFKNAFSQPMGIYFFSNNALLCNIVGFIIMTIIFSLGYLSNKKVLQ